MRLGALRDRWDRRDWLLILALLAIAVAAWSRVIFSKNTSFGIEVDFIRQFYPARVFAVQSLAKGAFPLWNPHLLSGFPFMASYQTALFYPPNIALLGLYALAGAAFPLKAQVAYVVFHFFLAGAFTYLLCRELRIGRTGAMIASVAYMFSGYLVAHAGHVNQQNAAAWIPLIFFFFYRTLSRRKLGNAVAGGVALGIALLAGHFQPLFYLCVFLFTFVIYSAIRRRWGDPRMAGLAYGLGALLIMGAIALAISAVQLIPTAELIRLSTRQGIPFAHAREYSLPARQFVTLAFPHFYGTGIEGAGYFGKWQFWELYGYAGITTLALAVLSLRRRDTRLPVFLGIAAVLSLALALGPGCPLFSVLFKLGLGFNRMRDPARILVIFGFSVSLMAGFGADHLLENLRGSDARSASNSRKSFRWLFAVLAFVLVLALVLSVYLITRNPASRKNVGTSIASTVLPCLLLALLALAVFASLRRTRLSKALGLVLVLLVLADLVALNVPAVTRKINASDHYGDRAAGEYLARRPGVFRVEPDANTMYMALDNGAVYGIQKSTGDDSLVLRDFYRYRELITPAVSPGVQLGLFYGKGLDSPLLDLQNDVYFISRKRIDPRLNPGRFKYQARRGDVYIYRNLDAMPRAWISPRALELPENSAALTRLKREPALTKDEATVVAAEGTIRKASVEKPQAVKVVKYSPQRIELEVPRDARGLLVLSEVDYPGWEARVDGKKREILATDYLFRGVALEGGQRKVVFRYRPRSFVLGAAVSLATLALLCLYLLYLLLRRRAVAGRK